MDAAEELVHFVDAEPAEGDTLSAVTKRGESVAASEPAPILFPPSELLLD